MSDAATTALPEPGPKSGPLRVVVVSGRDQGKRLAVESAVLVGTSDLCDLKLTDRTVSRRHLLVEPGETGLRIRDQDSRNGTWCAQGRVYDIDLNPGAELRVGNTTLTVARAEASSPSPAAEVRARFGGFLGRAKCLQPMYRNLDRAAGTDVTVLIEGESGTGKELIARAIHDKSGRARRPYEVVDLSAIPANLVESHLFGHEKGAFTGATSTHIGAFERASGGTIFLDEIGEMPLDLQTRLLRVLEEREIRRVGGSATLPIDVRVIAATNRNLEREVEEKRFRVDVFYRLAVVFVRVPPLRERAEDVELLARHQLTQCGGEPALLTPEVLERIRRHPWPGNVRELRNFVERLTVLGGETSVAQAKEPNADSIHAAAASGLSFRPLRDQILESFTEAYVHDMLQRHGGNVSKAAQAAGIARRYFQKLKKR